MRVYKKDNTPINLKDSDFIAQGGQGSVYGKDNFAYKIYTDAKESIPEKKIKELNKIKQKDIIKPEFPLFNIKGDCIGYAMKKIDTNISLCQMFNNSFKTKNSISYAIVLNLIEDIKNKVQHVHDQGILIVDFNEMNFLVDSKDYSKAYFIDVDSYKTPNFEAGAIAEHIRDRHTNGFTIESDWFSFSIIAFRLMTGLHPYKGRHKVYKKLEERMLANVSAFNPEVGLPASCPSFDIIPDDFRDWLKNVLEEGKRSIPPMVAGSSIIVPNYKVSKVTGLGNFKITTVKEFKDKISRYLETPKESICSTFFDTWVGNLRIGEPFRYVHEENGKTYLAGTSDGMTIDIYDYQNKTKIKNDIKFRSMFSIDNKVCYKQGGSIYRVKITTVGGKSFVSSQLIGNVMENSTQILENTLVQNMLGNYFVSVFDNSGGHYSVKIDELKGYTIVDGKYENKVLIIKGVKSEKINNKIIQHNDKFVIIFSKDFNKYSVRKIADVGSEDVNFAVIESKNIACHIREDSIELFSNDINSKDIKEIQEKDTGNLIAVKSVNYLTAIDDNKLIRITMG